jgi:hypothetical protein
MGLWGLRGRCRGCPVSFLQLAIKPVRAIHWNGVVVQLRNYYLEWVTPAQGAMTLGSSFASPNSQGIALRIFLGLFS